MTSVFLIFWAASAAYVVLTQKAARLIIYLGVFSLTSFGCFLLLSAPDVAMAQAVVSVFTTIVYIVALEKFHSLADTPLIKTLLPACFSLLLAALFIWFIPGEAFNAALKEQYMNFFRLDVGGDNAVTAIYMGYRLYDTLFEALMLLASIMAVAHLSWHEEMAVTSGKASHILGSDIAAVTIRTICPVMLLFSVYLVMNGHLSPGGGFQGGVVAASLFVCRYLVHDLYDIRIERVFTLEKVIFIGIVALSVLFLFLNAEAYNPAIHGAVYMIMMNLLIGLKVACGFLIVFYRFIALERR